MHIEYIFQIRFKRPFSYHITMFWHKKKQRLDLIKPVGL